MNSEQLTALLAQIRQLEVARRYPEVVKLCESAIDGQEGPEVQFALSRSCHTLAVAGNEIYAWPALLAALDAIEKQYPEDRNVTLAIGICRWVLELFADTHRLDVRGLLDRLSAQSGELKAESGEPEKDPSGSPLSALSSPLEFRLSRFEELFRKGEYVNLGNAILAAAPTVLRYGRSEEWIAREARYLFANVASPLVGMKVAELLSAYDFPMPAGHDAQHYDRYLLTAARVRRQQRLAKGRGVPSILLASLPKAASEFLCYTLAEALEAAVVRVTIGDPILGAVHAPWVATAAEGGCVTHDHFAASKVNLAALRAGDAARIFVLVRDPRAAFWSYENMWSEWEKVPPTQRLTRARLFRGVRTMNAWIDSWIQAKKAGFPTTFLRFKDLIADPVTVMGGVLYASGATRFIPQLREVLRLREERKRLSSNFRRGDDDAWREHVPAEMHAAIWDLISPDVRNLLDLSE
jgi:hypothetical protein